MTPEARSPADGPRLDPASPGAFPADVAAPRPRRGALPRSAFSRILRLRFGLGGQEPLTLKKIGKKLGLTRERVRQIQRNGLAMLNELMTE